MCRDRAGAVATFVFGEILGHMPGKKDVSGVATIHHPLGHVDPGTGDVGALVHIHHAANWTAVNAHANLQARMSFKRATDFHRALHRCLRIGVENQRHAVPGGDP